MLAQNFKTPAELEIEDVEFETLVKVLGMLERGEIRTLPKKSIATNGRASEADLQFFDMEMTALSFDCGIAGCFLGWMTFLNPGITTSGKTIRSLFLPPGEARRCRDPQKAAIALRNYLTHGEPRWDEALSG